MEVIWEFDRIKGDVASRMSEKRFKHVLGVVETAKELAARHGVNVEHAALAALIHDVVKEQDLKEARQILIDRKEHIYLEHSSRVWHAPLGAFVAKEKFGIENVDILNAIKYHTTGRSNMSKLEQVLFIADYTEPNRKFEGCVAVRKLWDELDEAVCETLKQKLTKIKYADLVSHPDTLAAYEYYKQKVGV